MKKAIFLGIFAIAAISFWSCSKEVPVKDTAEFAKEALDQMKVKATNAISPEKVEIGRAHV